MDSSSQIEERAAIWLAKREDGDWNAADEAALSQWLDASVLNRVAFLRLEAAWEEANRLKALGAGFPRGQVPSVEELQVGAAGADVSVSATRSTWRRKWGAVAAVVFAAVLATAVYTIVPFGGQRYTTPVGGLSTVPLKDGSNITLNTASRIRVTMTDQERRVELAEGEAFFDVAKDPMRPFVVNAGSKNIVAVGTQFSVRRAGDEVYVVVTEGSVRVDEANRGRERGSEAVSDERSPAKLVAGVVARVTPAATMIETASLTQATELLSWRTGYVVFRETALADAVAEFNRYNERKIVIRDPSIASMRLTGKFRANNFEGFVRLLQESFPIRTQHHPDEIVLTAASAIQ